MGSRNKAGITLLIGALLVLGVASPPARAAISNPPREDIDYIAEHLAETALDVGYFAIPWPTEALAPDRWQAGLTVGWSEASDDAFDFRGGAFGVQAFRPVSARIVLGIGGFYDSFEVGGGSGELALRPGFVPDVPLDLPEFAQFSNPRGTFRHYGLVGQWFYELGQHPERGWSILAGLAADHLELDGYRFDTYCWVALMPEPSFLDHSSQATYFTPFVGVQRRFPLTQNWALAAHMVFGEPGSVGDIDGRITGPGFDLSSQDPGGTPGDIGDNFLSLGVSLRHRPSGIEVDIGSTLSYPLFESETRPGIHRALLLLVTWSPRPSR